VWSDGRRKRRPFAQRLLVPTESNRQKGWGFGAPGLSIARSPDFPLSRFFVELCMNYIIYIVGLVVVILAILSFLGLG
jgi:hypothetical protein